MLILSLTISGAESIRDLVPSRVADKHGCRNACSTIFIAGARRLSFITGYGFWPPREFDRNIWEKYGLKSAHSHLFRANRITSIAVRCRISLAIWIIVFPATTWVLTLWSRCLDSEYPTSLRTRAAAALQRALIFRDVRERVRDVSRLAVAPLVELLCRGTLAMTGSNDDGGGNGDSNEGTRSRRGRKSQESEKDTEDPTSKRDHCTEVDKVRRPESISRAQPSPYPRNGVNRRGVEGRWERRLPAVHNVNGRLPGSRLPFPRASRFGHSVVRGGAAIKPPSRLQSTLTHQTQQGHAMQMPR